MKNSNYLIFVVTCIFVGMHLSLLHAVPCPPPRTGFCEISASDELSNFSGRLRDIQNAVRKTCGADEIFLSGGGALSLLNHIFFGKPLMMRDTDIFVVLHRPIDKPEAERIAKALEREFSGKYPLRKVDKRVGFNPNLFAPENTRYAYAYSLGFESRYGDIEISLHANVEDMALQGLTSIDRIKIPLHSSISLEEHVRTRFSNRTYSDLVREGLIIDNFDGYSDWMRKTTKVLNWGDIALDTPRREMRVIRMFVQKLGRNDLPINVRTRLFLLMRNYQGNPQILAGLLKTLNHDRLGIELKIIDDSGLIAPWSEGLHREIQKRSSEELNRLLLAREKTDAGERLRILLNLLPVEERRKIILRDVVYVDKGLAGKMIRETKE